MPSRLTLDYDRVETIISELIDADQSLNRLLDTIEEALPSWSPRHESVLDTIYRTRLRHMFAMRQPEERVAALSRHIHVAKQLLEEDAPKYSARLASYEALLNDALMELQSGEQERILSKAHVKRALDVLGRADGQVPRDDLKTSLGLKDANLSRIIHLMEASGFVERLPDESDNRVRNYAITAAGRAAYEGLPGVVPRAVLTQAGSNSKNETTPQHSPKISRILGSGELIWVPGFAFGAGASREYRETWMEYVAQEVGRDLEAVYKQKIRIKKHAWPNMPWDLVFDGLIEQRRKFKQSPSSDLCFEFMYLDPERSGRYGVFEVATVHNFSILGLQSNPLFQALHEYPSNTPQIDAWLTADEVGFNRTANLVDEFEKLCVLIADRGAWRFLSLISTATDNLINDYIQGGIVDPNRQLRLSRTDDLLDELREHPHSSLVIVDDVIARKLKTKWNSGRMAANIGPLTSCQCRYPLSFSMGVPYASSDPQWASIVHRAMRAMLASSDKKVRTSWQNTLSVVREIKAELIPALAA